MGWADDDCLADPAAKTLDKFRRVTNEPDQVRTEERQSGQTDGCTDGYGKQSRLGQLVNSKYGDGDGQLVGRMSMMTDLSGP